MVCSENLAFIVPRDDSALAASLERTYGLEKAIMLDMQVHSTSMVPSLTLNKRGICVR